MSVLTKRAVRAIQLAVDKLFDRVKARALGPDAVSRRGDKKIFVVHKPALTIPGIYKQAAAEEATKPNDRVMHSLVEVATSYLDAERERTKARTIHAVNAWLASNPDADARTVLEGELAGVAKQVIESVVKIVDSTATVARNMGTLEGISKAAASRDVEDPVVYFVVVRDQSLCKECRTLHLLPDGVTPRVFRLSEVSQGFHKRGDKSPSIGGLHPHCRCTIASLVPGYGFGPSGMVRFVDVGHDELAAQRG
jgi:hypothetical protein